MQGLTQTYRSLLSVLVVFFLIVSVGVLSYNGSNRLATNFNLSEDSFQKTSGGEPIYSIDIRLPVILSAFPIVRKYFFEEAKEYAVEIKADAEYLYNLDKSTTLLPFYFNLDKVDKYESKTIKGFSAFFSMYTGGAHDNIVLLSLNYSAERNSLISNKELLSSLGIDADHFIRHLESILTLEGYDKVFLATGLENLDDLTIHANSSNSTDTLELIFPPYAIAPYSEGIIRKSFSVNQFRLEK